MRYISEDNFEDFAILANENGTVKLTTYRNYKEIPFRIEVCKVIEFIYDYELVYTNAHAAVESKDKEHIFFFNESNIYIFSVKERRVIDTKRDQNIQSI